MADGEVVLTQKTYSYPGVGFISTWMLEDSDFWVWSALVGNVHLTDDEHYINEMCAFSNAKLAVEKHTGNKLGVRV